MNADYYLNNTFDVHKVLNYVEHDMLKAYEVIKKSFEIGCKLLVCGNGGSAGDADHITGELMKGFLMKRPLDEKLRKNILRYDDTGLLCKKLQMALPVINLSAQCSLITALCNDIGQDMIFAQQVLGYGKSDDVLLGISTSGNSDNVVYAGIVAKSMGLKTIGLTGQTKSKMDEIYDIVIKAPSDFTPVVQDMHRPIYHTLCVMLEQAFFRNNEEVSKS